MAKFILYSKTALKPCDVWKLDNHNSIVVLDSMFENTSAALKGLNGSLGST